MERLGLARVRWRPQDADVDGLRGYASRYAGAAGVGGAAGRTRRGLAHADAARARARGLRPRRLRGRAAFAGRARRARAAGRSRRGHRGPGGGAQRHPRPHGARNPVVDDAGAALGPVERGSACWPRPTTARRTPPPLRGRGRARHRRGARPPGRCGRSATGCGPASRATAPRCERGLASRASSSCPGWPRASATRLRSRRRSSRSPLRRRSRGHLGVAGVAPARPPRGPHEEAVGAVAEQRGGVAVPPARRRSARAAAGRAAGRARAGPAPARAGASSAASRRSNRGGRPSRRRGCSSARSSARGGRVERARRAGGQPVLPRQLGSSTIPNRRTSSSPAFMLVPSSSRNVEG